MNKLISLVFSAILLCNLTGCVGYSANLFGRNGNVSIDNRMPVMFVPQQQQQCFPAVVVNPNSPYFRQKVCAIPGDPNVQFLSFHQAQQGGGALSANNCPSGYRMNSQGSWMCRD